MEHAPIKIYLNVPFEEKTDAKRLGAQWDMDGRGWWTTFDRRDRFERWLPRMFRPDAKAPVITSEMVPGPNWYINCRSLLPKEVWDRLRRGCYDRAGSRCEVCGGRGPDWPVECNEQWQYIESPTTPGVGVQKLLRLVALCPTCHTIKHLGKAQLDGRIDAALDQLTYVNGWTREQAEAHADQAFFTWERRSAMEWSFDLSVLRSWEVGEVALNGYDIDPIPLIEGVPVVVYPTCAHRFNAVADLSQMILPAGAAAHQTGQTIQ